ncbi:Methylmalonyl-CoA epimerase [Geodia barretti]|uniref:Methylmalonyl-CoA epimerase n=1 Tax=Geodia barretti TaxID=519541 RepID=A0AA35XB37_GEOBA|nr:Methylmalonyl-CoA epimerase [Geodia barretti]
MTLPGTPPVATDLVHHIGIAVSSLDESIEFYRGLFGFKPGKVIVREDIGVRGCFVPVGETNLELLEGTSPDSLITTHIANRGEGLHHVCFEVEEIADKLKTLDELGVRLIDKVPRTGLMGGDIGFMHPSAARGVLIELAQHGH